MTDEEWLAKISLLSDRIEDLQDRIREIEITLHGKRAKTGLLAEYERHDELLARLYSVIWQDPTGQKGVLHDIDILMERRSSKAQGAQYKWQFWALIISTLISSGFLLISNLDKFIRFLPTDKPDKVSLLIEKAKHPKSSKKIFHTRVIPPPVLEEPEPE